jgi:hypothetical protein
MGRVPASLLLGALIAIAAASACGSESSTDDANADGGDDGSAAADSGRPGFPNDDNGAKNYPCDGCAPFPGLGAPECAPGVLGKATIAYPLDGLLLPPNMNVLEVQFTPPPDATLFEVDFYNAITKVKVETKCAPVPDVRGGASLGCGVTLPQGAWNDIANANRDGDQVGVVLRATKDGTCVSKSEMNISINFAKEDLAGGIYYWQSAAYNGVAGTTGGIYSHDFGTFDPAPTPFYTSGATGTCVGCHTLSRDGFRMSLATDDPDADDEFGDVKTHTMDVATRSVIGGSTVSPGFQTFTHDHAKMIASTFKGGQNKTFQVWDGDGKALLATTTLPAGMTATQPDLSRDDTSLVFVVPKAGTISKAGDHHFEGGSLFWSTFDPASNAMGAPTQLLADAARSFYYPTISPNGTFVLFNDAPQPGNTATTNNDAFTNRGARVKLLHFPGGGAPIDLAKLNVADGLTNSWPRWSPFVQTYKGKKILWVTFSSNRDYGLHLINKGFDNCYPPEGPSYDLPTPASKKGVLYAGCAQPQIWMAAVVIDEDPSLDSKDRSYPAFWLPFQDVNSHNHSAQWVEKVQGPPGMSGDGGTPPQCVQANGACGPSAACCSDTVCCNATCQITCVN